MNLLADEGVDKPIVDKLRQGGHEVAYIAEMSPGIDDDTILRQANDSGALLLTLDKDFGEFGLSSGIGPCRCHLDPACRSAPVNKG